MGTTTASVHFLAPSVSSKDFCKKVTAAYLQLGYVAAKRDDDPAAKTVVVSAPSARGFFSIYDSDNAAIDNGELKDLAVIVSRLLKSASIFTSVYDSDRFELLLFAKGKPVDVLAGSDDELPGDTPRLSRTTRPRTWKKLFGAEVDARALAAALDVHPAQAEDTLAQLVSFVGLDAIAALSHFEEMDLDTTVSARLTFVRDPNAVRLPAGTPSLRYHFLDDDLAYHRIAPASWPVLPGTRSCEWALLSEAAGFDRATIRVAIEGDPTFRVESGTLASFKFYNGQIVGAAGTRPVEAGPATAAARSQGEGRFVVELDGLGVPARDRASTTKILLLGGVSLSMDRGEAAIRVTIEADGADPAELPAVRFAVVEPSWIPIVSGADPDFPEDRTDQNGTHRVEAERVTAEARTNALPLNHSSVRSSVAIYADDAGMQPLRQKLESWLASLADADGTFTLLTEKRMTPAAYVGKGRVELPPQEILSSKAWTKLFAADNGLQTVRAGFTPRGGTHPVLGFGMQTNLDVAWSSAEKVTESIHAMHGRSPVSPNGGTIHAFRWCLNHPSCAALLAADAADPEWIDDLAARTELLQGWTAAWCWIPLFDRGDGYETTPYERASTINWFRGILPEGNGLHDCKMERTWCRNVLRAVSERLWIGEAMLPEIDEEQLRAVADVHNCGNATRIELKPGAGLAQLERALLSILPVESQRMVRRRT